MTPQIPVYFISLPFVLAGGGVILYFTLGLFSDLGWLSPFGFTLALVMISLTSGMNLMGIDISYQYIVRALVLAAAVIFDVATRSRGK